MRLSRESEMDPDIEVAGRVKATLNGKFIELTNAQSTVILELPKSETDILAVHAPAGTGKTQVLTIYILNLIQNVTNIIIVTAPTNLATQEIAENVLECTNTKLGEIIFLQSSTDEIVTNAEDAGLWKTVGIPEVFNQYLKEPEFTEDKRFMEQYVEKRLSNDGNLYQEIKA